jgi:hypothetical protein
MSSAMVQNCERRFAVRTFFWGRLFLLLCLGCFLATDLSAAPVPFNKPSNYPAWWFARDVIAPTDPSNNSPYAFPSWPGDYPTSDDYAAINQGQFKNFATQAYSELQASAPSWVWSTTQGYALTNLIASWSPTSGDAYVVVNLGQLKTVAKPFYDVLILTGYSNAYPWTGTGADDYSAANIGQVKNAFSFNIGLDSDYNGLPDWWEIKYFGQTGNVATSSPDGNGLTLLQDYQQGNDPTNYYSQGGHLITPTITVGGGNNQIGSVSTFLSSPLTVTVVDSGNNLLHGAPVTFAISGTSGGAFSNSLGGPASATLTVTTNSSGVALVYYAGPNTPNTPSSIQATTGPSMVAFSENTTLNDGSVAAPSGINETWGGVNGQIILNWSNNASNATTVLVQQSIDNVYWTTVRNVLPTTTSCTLTETDPNQSYYFGVIAEKP